MFIHIDLLIADADISVSNKQSRTKVLEPGAVIDNGGAKTVFNEDFSTPDQGYTPS
ncbi:MAG: hypothetical protein JSU77_05925 [Fidelibacterota bacterium]|nr:MAG: hypothetical protein JSU77_05925 [Candidatus Neomarinimicrobiota bacterium]